MTDKPDAIPSTPSTEDYEAQPPRPLIPDVTEPFGLLEAWLKDAGEAEPYDASAVSLATVDSEGLPDARIVLIRGLSAEDGLTFFTNYESEKGRQLADNPKAALCFHWKSVRRQVRLRGPVVKASAEVSDAYFNQRAVQSRIAAVTSKQSSPLTERAVFEQEMAQVERAYDHPDDIPRPAHWGGYVLKPDMIEFWQDQNFRTHDRLQFKREGAGWAQTRLYP